MTFNLKEKEKKPRPHSAIPTDVKVNNNLLNRPSSSGQINWWNKTINFSQASTRPPSSKLQRVREIKSQLEDLNVKLYDETNKLIDTDRAFSIQSQLERDI